MQCDEFEARFQSSLDARQLPELDQALAGHAQACAPCRELLAGWSCVDRGLAEDSLPEPTVDLTALVLRAMGRNENDRDSTGSAPTPGAGLPRGTIPLQFPRSRPRHARAGRWVLVAAAAAAVLAGATFWPRQRSEELVVPKVADAPHDRDSDPALGTLAREATSSYLDLARETRNSLDEALTVVAVVADRTALPDQNGVEAPEAARANALQAASWVRDVTDGLKPLARSTSGALDSLMLVIPQPPEDTRS